MRRLAPRSLAGQMALLIGVALLIAQIINFALILNERQKLSLAQTEAPAIARFAQVAADLATAAPEFRSAVLADASRRGARFALQADPGVAEPARDERIEARVASALAAQGLTTSEIRATIAAPAAVSGRGPRDMQALLVAVRRGGEPWLTGRILTPRRDPWLAVRLGAATLLVYAIVLGASIWLARRIARPLRDLTRAAEAFGGRQAPAEVPERGPADVQRAIRAFNAMNRRVIALLDEKDRMLGAIGHDLRTPLASLRIRVESMEPEEDREAAAAKIAEVTAMLEDILVLARSGRAREQARRVDVAALVDALAEEHRSLGRDVRFEEGGPVVAQVQPGLLKRAVGNLIDNAVKYGGSAVLSVRATGAEVVIEVRDRGPGLPADQLEKVLQPFYRLEASRNRETGGSGLGLAIASSIAESHGGSLKLLPAETGGIVARLSIPAAPAQD